MARDKLITIRIEGEKRQAFGDLAKSQNTDTASLLYDFISGCLDGKIDIKLVTGKGNRLDKIDNQIDTNRLDKLETTTQEIDNRLDTIAKKLTDWVEAFSDRLNDSNQGLSNKITSLEHRLNALASQLDSQQDSQQIDRIDTDSQVETPDIEPVATVEAVYTVETAIESVETAIDTVESVTDKVESDSIGEPVTGSIGPVPGDSPQMKTQLSEGMNAADAYRYLTSKKVKVSDDSLYRWIRQEKIPDSPQGKKVQKYLTLINKVYYPIAD
jgi:uncharacterized phage infection (PIP) family protein YhgE